MSDAEDEEVVGMSDDDNLSSDGKMNSSGKKEDKANNNRGDGPTSAVSSANPFNIPGFPANLAAMAAGAGGGDGGDAGQMNSVYGLIGNIQALLKMAVENAKQEERHAQAVKNGEEKNDFARRTLVSHCSLFLF